MLSEIGYKNEKNTIILRCYTEFGGFDRKYWLLF